MKQPINTESAPSAIGTYSQAISVPIEASSRIVFLSGQIPLDPTTMETVSEDVGIQTEQVFKNLAAVAEAAGGTLNDLAKLTVYLTDLADFGIVNEVMARHVSEPYPARAAIGVSELPRGVSVEIEGVLAL
jgi:reactive intermediate/imine deaminase